MIPRDWKTDWRLNLGFPEFLARSAEYKKPKIAPLPKVVQAPTPGVDGWQLYHCLRCVPPPIHPSSTIFGESPGDGRKFKFQVDKEHKNNKKVLHDGGETPVG